MNGMPGSRRLRNALWGVDRAVSNLRTEAAILEAVQESIRPLLESDAWLPDAYAFANAGCYEQYLLYRDPDARYSVVSFAWGPGAVTPIHNHTTWGVIGVLRGAECVTSFDVDEQLRLLAANQERRLDRAMMDAVSPILGDVHMVRNAYADKGSVSVHVYGADIGMVSRSSFDPVNGSRRTFVSGYTNEQPLLGDLRSTRDRK
jgi:predicted metal-dependent enzyme (double-stranded beta helix superfamily)